LLGDSEDYQIILNETSKYFLRLHYDIDFINGFRYYKVDTLKDDVFVAKLGSKGVF
jgi:hypothetical protein